MTLSSRPTARILLVEDSPADVRLVQEAIKQAELPIDLVVVHDGEEALEFLYGQGAHASAAPVSLVLLDLNLPGIHGREVLETVKSDEALLMPVIVMTTSQSAEDIRMCYDLHANGYVSKPSSVDEIATALEAIYAFWFQLARLPRGRVGTLA